MNIKDKTKEQQIVQNQETKEIPPRKIDEELRDTLTEAYRPSPKKQKRVEEGGQAREGNNA